ncbi:hypothetical protein [Microbulbifer variabilis]|uniref:hypothetical protein n=1 Tax=Microbulbifer variabilis TaxID=266805 RepID=UPI001CFCD8C6|nr:hypothetical protein [Microbulbifer variabilis]
MKRRQEDLVMQCGALQRAARGAVARRDSKIDADTLSQLATARQRALAQKKTYYRDWTGWVGFTGACATLLVLLLWPAPNEQAATELLSASEWLLYEEMDVEMVEDMEFYQWLAEEMNGHSS